MPLAQLELNSDYGDQSLAQVRFFLYPATHATEAINALESGLTFVEGQPVVTTNFVFAHDLLKHVRDAGVGEPGAVLLFMLPDNIHMGYGIFTSAYLDLQLRRVSGSPIRYAAGRKQLALYATEDTEVARVHIEAEVANGFPLEQRPRYSIDPKYVVGAFYLNDAFDTLVNELGVSAKSLEAFALDRFESSMREVMQTPIATNAALAPQATHQLVLGTIEATVMSSLRMMRWEGLALLGYRFIEGHQEIQIPHVDDIPAHRKQMEDMSRLLASSAIFSDELNWLKLYALRELDKMRVELDGAELRSMPD